MTTTTSDAPASPPPAPKRSGLMRMIKWLVVVLVLVIVVGLVVLFAALDGIVKKVVVSQSQASLNVPTNLGSANISLLGGKVSLKQFDVGQPQGFKSPQLMQLGGLDVGVKVSELRQQPLKISQITITDPKMVIEMAGTQFNIKKFIDSLPQGDPKPADSSSPPMKLIIDDLKLSGAQVTFKPDVAALGSMPGIGLNVGGLKSEYVLSIPPLDMQNIGNADGNQNGAAIKDVVTLLVTQLASKATESDQLPPELRQLLHLNVNDMAAMAKQKLGAAVNQELGKITDDLSKKLPGDAGKALGGLLNNSPDGSKQDPEKAIEQGLGGLLNQKKDSKKKSTPPATPATQAQ